MPDGFLAPPKRVSRPRIAIPNGATDCHAHIFGPFKDFPLAPERHYTPPELPGGRYLKVLDQLGFQRGVLVQGSAHGLDCGALLAALDEGCGRLVGVATARPDIGDDQLLLMQRKGVRALRFCRPPGGLSRGAVDFDAVAPLALRMAELGWHVQVQTTCSHLLEIMPALLAHNLTIVVDHMCLADPDRGRADAAFQGLLGLMREGRVWLKTTAYRLSTHYPNYPDMRDLFRACVEANPDRLLWGSDWPHVHMTERMPSVTHLVELLHDWCEDAILFRKILVDNPARLYAFPDPSRPPSSSKSIERSNKGMPNDAE